MKPITIIDTEVLYERSIKTVITLDSDYPGQLLDGVLVTTVDFYSSSQSSIPDAGRRRAANLAVHSFSCR